MNKSEFERNKSKILARCKIRPIQGVIRFSSKEGEWHFNQKCRTCYMLERGWIIGTKGEFWPPEKGYFPKWFKPTWYTEIRFKNGLRADILMFQPEDTFVIEIADTELDSSLEKKRTKCDRMGITMLTKARR